MSRLPATLHDEYQGPSDGCSVNLASSRNVPAGTFGHRIVCGTALVIPRFLGGVGLYPPIVTSRRADGPLMSRIELGAPWPLSLK
jgi:hypothetical protein